MRAFADVDVRLALPRPDLLAAIGAYDAIVVKSVVRVDAELLDAASRLRAVARAGVGLDNIDVAGAQRRGVPVLHTPRSNANAVGEFTVALILMLLRNVVAATDGVSRGDFRRHLVEGRELGSLAVGIVGMGHAGAAVARHLGGFGCKLLATDPAPADRGAFLALGGEFCPLRDLLGRSDVVTLHVPLTDETRGLIGERTLPWMKPGAILINTARGAVVDAAALLKAIDAGTVGAAAFDTLSPEPPHDLPPEMHSFDHPLLRHPKVLVTPHMGASTAEAQRRIGMELSKKLATLLMQPDERRRSIG